MRAIMQSEANDMLIIVRPIAQEVVDNWQSLLMLITQVNEILKRLQIGTVKGEEIEGLQALVATYRVKADKINQKICVNIDELEALGCAIENYTEGIVDFPSVLNGREIMLCWKITDERVDYYHNKNETFKDRRAIEYGYL